MALTNYLLQTGLGATLVAICNEVRGERVSVFWMMLITFAVWALQLGWSKPWMRRFDTVPWNGCGEAQPIDASTVQICWVGTHG